MNMQALTWLALVVHATFAQIRVPSELCTSLTKKSAWDSAVRQPIGLVQLTIEYQHGTSVGGPINAAELEPDGRMRWYARKQSCPEN
jgi:hypothetical protein